MSELENPMLSIFLRGLQFLGYWHEKGEKERINGFIDKVKYHGRTVVLLHLYASMLILQFIDFFQHITNLDNITFNAVTSFFFLVSLTKLSVLWSTHCDYLFNEVNQKTTLKRKLDPEEHTIIEEGVKHARRMNYATWFFYCVATTAASMPCIISMLTTGHIEFLPIRIWLPFKLDTKLHTYMAVIYGMALTWPATLLAAFLEVMVFNLIMHAIIQLKLLQFKIRMAINTKNSTDWDVPGKVLECIKMHQDINKYVKVLDRLLKPIMLFIYMFYMFIFCVTGFQLLVVEMFSTKWTMVCPFLSAKFMELLILYWNASKLSFESLRLATTIWESDWYYYLNDINVTMLKQDLNFMILRAQKPLVISVGPFAFISMEVFTQAIRTAYSLLTFLRNFV